MDRLCLRVQDSYDFSKEEHFEEGVPSTYFVLLGRRKITKVFKNFQLNEEEKKELEGLGHIEQKTIPHRKKIKEERKKKEESKKEDSKK